MMPNSTTLNQEIDSMEILFSQFLNVSHVPTFVINKNHEITFWNNACEQFFGMSAQEMLNTRNQWKPFYDNERPVLADAIVDAFTSEKMIELYGNDCQSIHLAKGALESKRFFKKLGENGRWIKFVAAPLYNQQGDIVGAFEVIEDITEKCNAEQALQQAKEEHASVINQHTEKLVEENKSLSNNLQHQLAMEQELTKHNLELKALNEQLLNTQEQLERADKMASIGQLAAGVAHEINNPIGYIFSNIGSLENYIDDLFELLAFYESIESHINSTEILDALKKIKDKVEINYLKDDIPDLMLQSKDGIDRVRKIVQDLKDFSHVDTTLEWQWVNIHHGIESTLNVISNEVKYKADVIKEYGDIPDIECLPSQINQVIMNLVINATHAMSDDKRGTITINTSQVGDNIRIKVGDDGSGIPPDVLKKIFEPFFTTKPVGKGTGLGLSLSFGIIQKHQGNLSVESEVGVGTTFIIDLPIKQMHDEPAE